MSRGNARQDIVADDRDRRHFVDRLGSQVRRSGWELISFVLLSNHFHLRGLPTLWPLARGAGPDRPSRRGPRRRRVAGPAVYVDRAGELSRRLGDCRPECVAGILRRLEALRARGGRVDRDLDAIRERLRLPGDGR